MPAPFPTTHPTLATPGLTLRPLAEADIPSWFARATDAESAHLAGDPIPASLADGTAWLARHRQRFQEQTALRWAIVPLASPDSIGTIGLTLAAPGATSAELGYVLARAHWNRGHATAAARAVVAYALETLGLAELRADPLARNNASRRVLEKAGFRHTRTLPPDPPAEPEPVALYLLMAKPAG